ncbi:acyltransferase [Alteromonas sp. CYL-A6]|uniref:acyltransferase n=1 Tax=Alteromonas nitratireducens TaxID=3390813 RepID=UPI0034BA3CE4
MEMKGLTLQVEDGNDIEIDGDVKFSLSKIIVKGTGNKIKIGSSLNITGLIINLKGDNKEIIIGPSKKNISNLKIVSIRGRDQRVLIGKNFGCGGCEIQMNDGKEVVIVGEDCLFSWGIKIRTSDGHSVVDLDTGRAINLPEDVSIGNHVWVGEDARFLKGSIVPDNCIVGSASVITRAFTASNCVIAGFPAKVVKENVTWDRRMPYEYNSG